MKSKRRNGKADSVLVLLLFGVFAVCILSVLLTGADAYRRLSDRDRESYDARTTAQYITTRVRQADRQGGVAVRSFEGCPALVLPQTIDGTEYETLIYHHDGYIRELFAEADGDFLPGDGEKVLPAGSLLIFEEAPGLHICILDADGENWQDLWLHLRSGGEGAT
jgi:hypothetical protein